jgi:hypothetical protein
MHPTQRKRYTVHTVSPDILFRGLFYHIKLGLATEFRSEKIPRNRLGIASVIPRKKVLIPRNSEVYGRVYSEARNGRKYEKICFTKNPAPANIKIHLFIYYYFCSMVQNSEHFSLLWNGSERNSEKFLFRVTVGIPPEQTNCSVYSVFRGIIFCRKLPTLYQIRKIYGLINNYEIDNTTSIHAYFLKIVD